MSLASAIKELRAVSGEAKGLLATAMDLATRGKMLNAAQKAQFKKFSERLDEAAREASRARRDKEIAQLTKIIDAHKKSLTVTGLPSSAVNAIKADLVVKRSRRTRLLGQKTSDFGGILNAGEQAEIAELVQKAQAEVKNKKLASHFLDSLMKISDLALSLAGKLDI